MKYSKTSMKSGMKKKKKPMKGMKKKMGMTSKRGKGMMRKY
tara:strand:+ start:668 stop:790 length:123 start_codon:yes stop_codon:yes gene_type:complete